MKGRTILGLVITLMSLFSAYGQGITLPVRDSYLPDNIDTVECAVSIEGSVWDVKIGWSSDAIVSNHLIPLVGDLNDDGVPEIVCFTKDGDSHIPPYRYNNEFIVFDGFTTHVKAIVTLPANVTADDAAPYGLVKLPNRKGIIVVACCDYKLRAYDIYSSNPEEPYWVSDVDYGSTKDGIYEWAVNVSFADFNSDGSPEVYVRDKIYNAETGVLLAQADSPNSGSSYGHWSHQTLYKLSSPLAADVVGDDDLELILGNMIYDVEINNKEGRESNSITLVKSITPPSGVVDDGNVQVADFNLDGNLDVFISVRNVAEVNGYVYGYVWDVHDDFVSNPFSINTSFSGKSIPMIGDIDDDDLLEVLIQCGAAGTNEKFQAHKYNPDTRTFSYMWGIDVVENSYSNSITAFDFNQDGILELIICDEQRLRIVNGSGKSHITYNDTIPVYIMESFPYTEITIMQYPVIVDADNDEVAELVSVGNNRLNFIESDGAMWAPTRKVWNQYMYNVTNVNNDLTIPIHHYDNSMSFTDPDGVVRRPFNNFLQQTTTLDQYGRPVYAAADASLNDISMNNMVLRIYYSNEGDVDLEAGYSITAFKNQYGGEIMEVHTASNPLPKGRQATESFVFDENYLCGLHDLSRIVIALNCTGSGIAQYGGHQMECDTVNNLGFFDMSNIIGPSDTLYINKRACREYVWYGTPYDESGVYYHIVENEDSCDSIIALNLTVIDSLEFEIHGLTNLGVATDIWTGIYRFCIADSLELETCDISWECSNHDWVIIPTNDRYWCQLLVTTLGDATLTAHVDCGAGCANDNSLELHAFHIGVDEFNDANIVVYPNPAKSSLTIQADMLTNVRLCNCSGQTVKQFECEATDNAVMDVEDLPRGLYFVEISTLRGRVVKKVVLSKSF
ncbi:MAG: T9SS type A sorting domain-containing protein [Bacteroidales bacterium]|nr:T9SS type A sorting domain-containing protein [Bacteroidales bacterium]